MVANLEVEERTGDMEISSELEDTLLSVLSRFKGKKGVLIQALHAVQSIVGYLPPSVLRIVARELDVPLSEVYGVVTFYHFFSMKPRGKHVIQVCLGTACYVRGGQEILDKIQKELGIGVGEVTEDGLYSVEVMRCAGACGLAPVVRIDNDVHKRVNPSQIMEIISNYT
ncbi:NAD(P)H-dependent oxidoreductase subunit E [Atrimonas thermophila]